MSNIFDLFKKIETQNTSATGKVSWIVVGLGNPGKEYENTRHNVGFKAIDYISSKLNFSVNRAKFKSLTGECDVSGKRVLFLKPQTFMNNSGEAVSEAMNFYKIPIQNVIVIFDDISLQPGNMRIRTKGSAGGHNGIKSIIEKTGSNEFPRVKIGIGAKPHPDYDLADWVLGNIEKDAVEPTAKCIEKSCDAIPLIIDGKVDTAMGQYN